MKFISEYINENHIKCVLYALLHEQTFDTLMAMNFPITALQRPSDRFFVFVWMKFFTKCLTQSVQLESVACLYSYFISTPSPLYIPLK